MAALHLGLEGARLNGLPKTRIRSDTDAAADTGSAALTGGRFDVSLKRIEDQKALARYRNRSVFSQPAGPSLATRLLQLILMIGCAAVIGGVLYFGFWDYQPTPQPVVEVIPNERFDR